MIKAIDCSKWVGSPPEKEFIIQDWLSLGEVSFLKGEREVGKSLLAQQLMTSVATGKPLLNMDVKQVKAYGVFCESSKRDIIRRQCMSLPS
ncbi:MULTISPECIES: AAA family ATPase [Wolbachia]|nr:MULTISPECIES: AAA family ATPase [Wolbachia]MDD9335069.1 AAA family ATPase [Rickettsiaceae bacterium]